MKNNCHNSDLEISQTDKSERPLYTSCNNRTSRSLPGRLINIVHHINDDKINHLSFKIKTGGKEN